MTLTRILTGVLFIISLALAYYLYSGVQKVIDDKAIIQTTEAKVIERLRLIREAEGLYQEQNGKYTSSWDSLARFVKTASVPILQRREQIVQKPYGGEEVTVLIDTLGTISVIDKLCIKNYSMNAPENGVFINYRVKPGTRVIKNMKAYTMKVGDRTNEPPFQEKGVVDQVYATEGEVVKKGKLMLTYHDEVFDRNSDWDNLKKVPSAFPASTTEFEIFTKKIDRNGVMVDVIEVRDPKPINGGRKESNEQKARKPLRFGSRTDVSTAGNWE